MAPGTYSSRATGRMLELEGRPRPCSSNTCAGSRKTDHDVIAGSIVVSQPPKNLRQEHIPLITDTH